MDGAGREAAHLAEVRDRFLELTAAQRDAQRWGRRVARARAALVAELHAEGLSYRRIAALLGITGARVQQLVERHRENTGSGAKPTV